MIRTIWVFRLSVTSNKMKKKIVIILALTILFVGGLAIYSGSSDAQRASIVDCLVENEVLIYGSKFCPACTQLVSAYGGEEVIEPIYVECTDEPERCEDEKVTEYVPEIQIAGELYEGSWSPTDLAAELSCSLD